MKDLILPAEWAKQSAVQLTWPHAQTDWQDMLDEVIPCFREIAREVLKREKLIVVTPDVAQTRKELGETDLSRVIFREMDTNDTWARDHGAITLFENGKPVLCDFVFNGWGMKFAANHDNRITRRLYDTSTFAPEVGYRSRLNFVLEGGSLESDGKGTLLTTSECLLSDNRNDMTRAEVESYLCSELGFTRVLWLDSGYLAGDDTDSHIDTLARFCDESTIAYVQCTDQTDEHYEALLNMEKQLHTFRQTNGEPYTLIPLPMADAVWCDGERLPATYANFLIINGAVLLPVYGSYKDRQAEHQLKKAFPNHEIVSIDCLPLIKQHGSLHCVTMQYPEGVVL